jgi:ribose 5-phosphate isomerase A
MSSFATAKKAAAMRSLDFIEDGMTVGMGTGSTATFFIDGLIEKVRAGMNLRCVSSSKHSANQARNGGIEVLDINDVDIIDVTVDGADEVDRDMRLIKGGGGALTREKIVASNSRTMIVIVDESKLSDHLGHFPLPVEVVPFGYLKTQQKLKELGLRGTVRLSGEEKYITDNGNYIIDISLTPPIEDIETLNARILTIPGVVETGFFLGIASTVIVGKNDGSCSTKILNFL